MSDEPITPALTREEWAKRTAIRNRLISRIELTGWEKLVGVSEGGDSVYLEEPADRHALAALCLYQQPFGLAREDVDLMTLEIIRVQMVIQACGGPDKAPEAAPRWRKLLSLQARIAALLPPDTEERWPG